MNTPTHLILAATVFAKPDQPKITYAALGGALLPDFSLYFMVFWHRFALGDSPSKIFDEVYFSAQWQLVFAIDNSFIVWGVALALALALRSGWAIALAGAGLLHLLTDFPLHNDDARQHFWPLTNWKFISPVSYWDSHHYGGIVRPIETLAALVMCAILWLRFPSTWARIVIATTAIILAGLSIMVEIVFAGGAS